MEDQAPDAVTPRPAGRFVLGTAFAASVLVFLPTWASFAEVWEAQPYTHGWLLAIAGAWLVWRDRRALTIAEPPWRPALAVAVGASLLWLFASIASARMVTQAMLPILLLSWTAAVFGLQVARRYAPIAALFYLAIPLWGVLTRVLQTITVIMSGAAVDLLGVPAVIEGDMISTTYGSFLVEGGCAGLNYLMSGLTIAALYTLVIPQRWSTQLAVIGVAAGLSMLGNWIRVAGLVYLGHTSEMQTIFIRDNTAHLAFGWGIFAAGLAIFFPVAGWLVGREGRRRAPVAAETPGAPTVTATAAAPSPRPSVSPSLGTAILASLAVATGPLAMLAVGALPEGDVPEPQVFGRPIAWSPVESAPTRPYSWYPAFSGPDDRLAYRWEAGADTVVVDRLVYREQEQGAELIGYDSRLAPDSSIAASRLIVSDGPTRRLMNEAIVWDGDAPVLVWYWYRVGGLETESETRAKLLEIVAFFRRRTVSELIAVSTRCAPDDCTAASARLGDFLGRT